jgi:translation initiation factor 2 beta subunit (eIF-2beta)/eIF-5
MNSKNDIISNILTSDIPPDEWQRELERVSSKLKTDYSVSSYSTSEWRSHIEQIKVNEQNFAKAIPDSRSILENLSADIDRSLEKITKKEAMISKNFANIVIF